MKIVLLLSWLLMGGAGYYAYNFYQQSQADAQKSAEALQEANAANTDLFTKISDLTKQLASLQTQLAEEKVKADTPTSAPVSIPAAGTAPPTAADAPIPTTITTIYGKTYTGCVLSHMTPDGISFIHSMGVAKVLFSEMDPDLAKKFGYDPASAKKYQQDEAAREAQSDAMRSTADAKTAPVEASATTASIAPGSPAPVASPSVPSLSPGARASMQAQITSLQSDIAFMQGEENKVYHGGNGDVLKSTGDQVSHGGYPDRIAAEQAQIAELQQQLSSR